MRKERVHFSKVINGSTLWQEHKWGGMNIHWMREIDEFKPFKTVFALPSAFREYTCESNYHVEKS